MNKNKLTRLIASEFGQYLKQLRESAKMTQDHLAVSCGISKSYLSRIEGGKRRPPGRDLVIKLANALEIDYSTKIDLLRIAGYSIISDSTRIDVSTEKGEALFAVQSILLDPNAPRRDVALLLDTIRKIKHRIGKEDYPNS